MDRGLGTRFRPPDTAGSNASAGRSSHRGGDRGPGFDRRRRHGLTAASAMRIMRIILVLLAVSGIPRTLIGQRWERQVQERVQRTIAAVGASPGLHVVRRSGMLNTDEAASFRTTLVQGTPYAILGVCDDDCSRLQLTLLSPSGSDIAKERNSESLPTLHFTAATTAVYSIRVVMEGCRWNPCWYAIAVVPLRKTPS